MQTPTHLLVTAFLGDRYKSRGPLPVSLPPLLIGAVLPDIPFTLLTLGYTAYYRWYAPLPVDDISVMEYLHLVLFFQDPLWIIAHNFFHSLFINLAIMGGAYWLYRSGIARWGLWVVWLAAGMLFHTLVDIATHHSDGPFVFFPFNWTYRFPSPISYWEADHYGYVVIALESLVNVGILAYFAVRKWQQRTR